LKDVESSQRASLSFAAPVLFNIPPLLKTPQERA
jgi:hypothetical protein